MSKVSAPGDPADEVLEKAAALLREALDLLDSAQASADIAALVQSALDRLEEQHDRLR